MISKSLSSRIIITLNICLIAGNLIWPQLATCSTDPKQPVGTILLPITPKLDEIVPAAEDEQALENTTKPTNLKNNPEESGLVTEVSADNELPLAKDKDTAELDKPLKASVQIVADDTEFDEAKNTFLGTGNAVAIIGDQDSKLEADMILYNQDTQIMDARGNVKIIRKGQITTGSAFKFDVSSDEYLITKPDTELQGSEIISRNAFSNADGLAFKNGTIDMPQAFYYSKNTMNAPTVYSQDVPNRLMHPEAYVPRQSSFVFKARKMVYEKYKDTNNLTIFGGRLQFKHFSVPVGKIVTTINGSKEQRIVMPIVPYLGNNLYVGGTSIGAIFNTPIGKTGVLSYAPLIQLGGASLAATGNSNSTSIGVGTQLGYVNNKINFHYAYGTVSNLSVGDFKYKIWKRVRFQSGVNRFLTNGMFGAQRAHLIAEVVDNHMIRSIPLIPFLDFRTSAGWAQDYPQLVNLSPQFAKLFGSPTTTQTTSAFRLQEQIRAATAPLFQLGDDKYGISGMIMGGLVGRAYSTGDKQTIATGTPMLNISLNRLKLQTGYTTAQIHGSTPFVFDQYYMGSSSTFVSGSVRVNKFLDLGGYYGYNLQQKLPYAETVTAAIGPPDFKVILSHDMIFGYSRVGFGILYGQPIPFNKLVVKGNPDRGQLGGIQ